MSHSILQLKHLEKSYGEFKAVKKVSIDVKSGDFYALLGPNGAGKTTIIGMLTDLVRPSAGEIILDRFNYATHKHQAKQILGVVPQEINLSIFETVKQTMYQQAQYFGLKPKAVHDRIAQLMYHLDLESKFKTQVHQLSGGMKRRLMIARALVHQPKVLLLDEPTAGVDVDIRQVMWDFLKEENRRGLTIVLTTHYLEEAESLCNRVGVINHGRLVSEGNMSDLLGDLSIEQVSIEMEAAIGAFDLGQDYQWKKTNDKAIEVGIKNHQRLQDIIDIINAAGLRICRISHEKGRLEQIFSQLVSKKNSEQEGGA